LKKPVKTILALALLAVFCLISVAAATDTNTYTLEKTSPTDPVHLGDTVVITAETSNNSPDSGVNTVVFSWWAPGSSLSDPADYTSTDSTPTDGFTSSYIVNTPGEWTIKATFGRTEVTGVKPIWLSPITYNVNVRGNFFVVPEYPLIGAAGASLAMMFGLLVFKRKEIINLL
jgi:hypothetical protein